MTPRQLSMLLLMTGSSLVWGADSREGLNEARSDYRQAVSAHGEKSIEAKNARRKLRAARVSYHAERREHQHNRHSSR
jgi:hypothetical protein